MSSEYTVSPQADRMGYRLEGPTLVHAKATTSFPIGIVSGAIQVPGSGKPILLMVDNQPRGLSEDCHVISAAFPWWDGAARPARFASSRSRCAKQNGCAGTRKRCLNKRSAICVYWNEADVIAANPRSYR